MNSKVLLAAWLDNPSSFLFGMGSSSSFQIIGGYCHVVPVEVLCELGVAGLSLYLYLLFKSWNIGWQLVRDPCTPLAARTSQTVWMALFLAHVLLQLKEGSVLSMPTLLSMIATISGTVEIADRLKQQFVVREKVKSSRLNLMRLPVTGAKVR